MRDLSQFGLGSFRPGLKNLWQRVGVASGRSPLGEITSRCARCIKKDSKLSAESPLGQVQLPLRPPNLPASERPRADHLNDVPRVPRGVLPPQNVPRAWWNHFWTTGLHTAWRQEVWPLRGTGVVLVAAGADAVVRFGRGTHELLRRGSGTRSRNEAEVVANPYKKTPCSM